MVTPQDTFGSLLEPTPVSVGKPASKLMASDKYRAERTLQAALEKSVSGNARSWKNPSSGASGTATPLKTWKNNSGDFCRSYRERIKLADGNTISRRGVACRTGNAVWKAA
ncbi:17 kDa surface antigen precursor [Stappia aggregata IAM 12614]|uniref:17 kDa surface antigen n=2 Tax=Roseibium aggregatum TaxID=187304 RepID=A0NX57_ROSAI|nr:17 kDa surface antigen precursor [Stappia aggregata IAM 12614] [Roseibium aggregatum IAM 12614]